MFIINHRKIFFTLSTLLILGSIFAMFAYGFNLGIDFKGGSLLEVSYTAYNRPDAEVVKSSLNKLNTTLAYSTTSGLTLTSATALGHDSARSADASFHSSGCYIGCGSGWTNACTPWSCT